MFAEREKYTDEQIARLRTMKKWMVQRRHKIDADIYKKAGNLIKEFYASGTDGDYIEYYAVDNFIADNIEDYVTCIEVLLK